MDDMRDMTGSTVIITGGNSGIGYEAAVDLVRRGATVVITARNRERGEAAVEQIRRRTGSSAISMIDLDLASLDSVRAAADELLAAHERIDVLVNNAGAVLSSRTMTVDGFEATFAGNHLGHHLLTNLLLERLQQSAPARVVTVASLAHHMARNAISFDDLDRTSSYRPFEVYAESKLANILFTTELARRLVGTGVTANACHPGSVRSGFGGTGDTSGLERIGLTIARPFMVSPARGAEPIVWLAASRSAARLSGAYVSGGYLPGVRQSRTSGAARDPELARRLWELSDELVGLVS
jgi:NAD(P)-dependent dehydrogenase (short-subunit alcohol dehydrogenase family)